MRSPSLIYISSQSLKNITDETRRFPNVETGGILVGVPLEYENFLITHATSPGPQAVRNVNSFRKDWDYTVAVLRYLEKRHSVLYLGEWHAHPSGLNTPSRIDLIAMKNAVFENRVQLLLMIMTSNCILNFYLISPLSNKVSIRQVPWVETTNPLEILTRYQAVKL